MANDSVTPPRDEIVDLRMAGMTRDDIADHFGVSVSRVKRWIIDMDIPAVRRRKPGKVYATDIAFGDDHGLTLIEKAKRALGARMGQDFRGYLLDGRPVKVDVLVQAAGLTVPNTN
jgi:hypothetical protein